MSLDRARSLRSDRAVCVLGRYVATKPCACSVDTYRPSLVRTRSLRSDRSVDRAWLELGRYVATEPCTCLVATYDRAWLVHGRFGYMYVVSDNWYLVVRLRFRTRFYHELLRRAQPCRYTVHRPGGTQPHRPEDALPPFPLVPNMSTHPERDFQRSIEMSLFKQVECASQLTSAAGPSRQRRGTFSDETTDED
ncbi:hypothetical protein F2Q70_00004201 [Brassica cretica]|uniref:Uncharacterized protein n=1 Tax=Brassica cretica TaxID=69181 RepID=A0A8S9IZN1_BRACR|nr:hypothetical protein F2Q70_00004201 [Brassica cretica]